MNKNTAIEYHFRLSNFEKFIFSQYEFPMNEFINNILQSKLDPYEILSDYCIYLQENRLHPSSLKNRVTTVKNFLEFNDVDISPRKFKLKVKFPKNIRRIREALDKNDITNILNSCSPFEGFYVESVEFCKRPTPIVEDDDRGRDNGISKRTITIIKFNIDIRTKFD
jgi:hypothetical protein